MLPIKPGSATTPMPGIEAEVVQMDGTPVGVVSIGDLALEKDRESALSQVAAVRPNSTRHTPARLNSS